jgi:hypothetical protein
MSSVSAFSNWRLPVGSPVEQSYGDNNFDVAGDIRKYAASYIQGGPFTDANKQAGDFGTFQAWIADQSARMFKFEISLIDTAGKVFVSLVDKTGALIDDGAGKDEFKFTGLKSGESIFVNIATPAIGGTTKIEQLAGQQGLTGVIAQDEANFLMSGVSDMETQNFPYLLMKWNGNQGRIKVQGSLCNHNDASNTDSCNLYNSYEMSVNGGVDLRLGLCIA